MKILFSVPSLTGGKGGAERVATELANEMVERGHEVIVYSSSTPSENTHYHLDSRIRHIQIPLHKATRVREAIIETDPDVFFIFYFDMTLLQQYALVADTGIPVGAQECTNPIRVVDNFFRKRGVDDLETAFAIRKACLSGMHGIRFTMESYFNYLPRIAQPSCEAFNNTFALPSKRADVKKENGRKRIISVGGLKAKNKNGVVLAKAFARIADDFPDWDLYYFGSHNLKEIHTVIKQNGQQERIVLAGKSDKMSKEYSKSQLHVICSFEEGCPNVVCEAMLHGIPSIGFADCSGTNELVRNNVNGILVERVPEIENLEKALRNLLADAGLREKLGEQAYQEALERFDSKRIYDRWESLLEHIASYKGMPERLFKEQCKIDNEAAERQRFLRTYFLQTYAASHFFPAAGQTNEKIALASNQPVVPLVSIIIPVFNKEEFIAETLDSVIGTSYPNTEILAVDDCSSDRSLEIIEQYAARHSNMHIIRRKKNGGLSCARNTGLDHAKGKYVSFWDADDIYSKNGLAQIIATMEIDQCCIATGIAIRDGEVLAHYKPSAHFKHRTTFLHSPEVFSTNSTCFKVYRHDFLIKHDLRFTPGLYVQDMEFNLRAFCLADMVTMTPYILGEYRYLANSWGKSISAARLESCFKIEELTKNFLKDRGLTIYEGYRQRHVLQFVHIFFLRKLLQMKMKNELGEFQDYFEKFRTFLSTYPTGVRELAKRNPLQALAVIAFCSGYDDTAFTLFRDRALINPEAVYRKNAFGMLPEELDLMVERMSQKRPVEQPAEYMPKAHKEKALYDYYDRIPGALKRILRKSSFLNAVKENYLD